MSKRGGMILWGKSRQNKYTNQQKEFGFYSTLLSKTWMFKQKRIIISFLQEEAYFCFCVKNGT